jgi:hypothetical protein
MCPIGHGSGIGELAVGSKRLLTEKFTYYVIAILRRNDGYNEDKLDTKFKRY